MRFRRRRAISYIMSVAVMTFVTLALASVVLVWGIGQTSQSQNVFASAINAQVARAMERFSIEEVTLLGNGQSLGGYTCSSSNGCVVVYVRDVGSIQLVVDAVYINGELCSQSQNSVNGVAPAKLSLGMQQLGTIDAVSPFQLSVGSTYTITAASSRGTTVVATQTF